MARTRRRRFSPRRRKADWVYRGNALGNSVDPPLDNTDTLGTYTSAIVSIASGLANARGHILYDSQNRFLTLMGPSLGGVATGNRAARAEGQKPLMLAVEGGLYFEPSAWAVGNVVSYGIRLGVFEQDPNLGSLLLPADYSMWNTGSSNGPDVYANNGRMNAREWRWAKGYTDAGTTSVARFHYFRWKGRRRLEPNECFALYCEVPSTSVTGRFQFWFRTLVSDEG